MLHQVAQQAELRRPEVDVLPVALDAVGRQVHGKVGEGQHLAAELRLAPPQHRIDAGNQLGRRERLGDVVVAAAVQSAQLVSFLTARRQHDDRHAPRVCLAAQLPAHFDRSEEHTSELQSLMRISYAVFCLKKKKTKTESHTQSKATTMY